MTEDAAPETPAPDGRGAGAMLAAAREAAGKDLAEVSATTRIPLRHLAAIEAGDYSKLPSRTYALGFSRTYARVLGLDERTVADLVRRDLESAAAPGPARPDRFEPGDPARVPSRRLAWFSALAALVLALGAFAFYRSYFAPGLGPAPLTADTPARGDGTPGAAEVSASPSPGPGVGSGPVVFTSLADGTWVKFYDSAGKRLFEGQLAKGQSFTVPADAAGPRAWTGRPNALAITVGGRPVAPLGTAEVIVKDVPVDAAALLARPAPASPPASPPATAAANGMPAVAPATGPAG